MRSRSSPGAVLDVVTAADSTPALGGVDWLFLLVVASLPWLPRPTIDGPLSMLAPAALVGFTLLYLFWAARGAHFRRAAGVRTDVLILFLVAFICAYALQIILAGRTSEMLELFSRVLFFVGILVTVEWLSQRDVAVHHLYAAVLVGFASLSLLIIFQGITGLGLFEPIGARARFYDQFPFFRNPGVPRSFGELGIIATASWAYLLTNGRRIHPVVRVITTGVVALAILISQSRNVWSAVALVTFGYLFLRNNFRVRVAQALAALALLAPIAVDFALPLLAANSATEAIIGENTNRRNVDERMLAVDEAIDLLADDPARSLLGYGRAAWFDRIEVVAGERLGIHNNYLAHLVFLGVVAGGISILVLYVIPMWRLARHLARSPSHFMVFLSVSGAFVNLNFYEGWFSPTLAVVLGALWFMAYSPAVTAHQTTQRRTQPIVEA